MLTVDGSHRLPLYFFFLLWKSMAIVNFLIANILWNIFVCVFNRRKKLIQVWNNLKMS